MSKKIQASQVIIPKSRSCGCRRRKGMTKEKKKEVSTRPSQSNKHERNADLQAETTLKALDEEACTNPRHRRR